MASYSPERTFLIERYESFRASAFSLLGRSAYEAIQFLDTKALKRLTMVELYRETNRAVTKFNGSLNVYVKKLHDVYFDGCE